MFNSCINSVILISNFPIIRFRLLLMSATVENGLSPSAELIWNYPQEEDFWIKGMNTIMVFDATILCFKKSNVPICYDLMSDWTNFTATLIP